MRAAADALASSGLRDAGYTYVNVDDCWMARTRGPDGALRPDPERFGGGIPPWPTTSIAAACAWAST